MPEITVDDLIAEQGRRQAAAGKCNVTKLAGPTGEPPWLVPGTLSIFWAPHGDPGPRNIAAAAEAGDWASIRAVADAADVTTTVALDRPPLVEQWTDIPVFGDLMYAGQLLLQGMPTFPGIDLLHTKIVYGGGDLQPESFSLTCHPLPGVPAFDLALIVNPPQQSSAERSLLAAIKPHEAEVHLLAQAGPMSTVAVTAVGQAAAATAREVAKAALAWGVGKTLDRAVDAIAADRRAQARDAAAAQRQWQLQRQAERAQFRNASLASISPALLADHGLTEGDAAQTTGTLLRLRERAILAAFGEDDHD
jgi:hypothetical protein